MTHDAWMIAITGVSGATLLLMCIGRKRLREIRDRIGMHIYRWMVISPAHTGQDGCTCDTCSVGRHYESLPTVTPADRYALDEARARLAENTAELAVTELELEAATQRLLDAIHEPCEPSCNCIEHTWSAIADAYGESHPDFEFEMDEDDADAWDEISASLDGPSSRSDTQ